VKKSLELLLYELAHLLRIKGLWFYALSVAGVSAAFFFLTGDERKVLLSLLSFTLLAVPLVSGFFSVSYFYDTKEFTEFLLAQPVGRGELLFARWAALALALTLLYAAGVAAGLTLKGFSLQEKAGFLWLALSGTFLTLSFCSLAFLAGVLFDDKAKGVSAVLAAWLYFTLLHDALILTVVYLFKDYPLEKPVVLLTLLSPVDLARLLVVLRLDVAALMGLTGTVIKELLGSFKGTLLSISALVLWSLVPFTLSWLLFRKKDL